MLRNIIQNLKRDILLTGAFVVELSVMILLGISLFAPSKMLEILPGDFGVESDKVIFESGAQNKQAVSRECELGSGAYEVSVYYDSQKSISGKITDVVGRVELDSAGNAAALKAGTIVLNDQQKCKTSTIWIGYGAVIDDLKVFVQYDGAGKLEFQKLIFRELPIYRFIRMIGFLLLFSVIDGIYIIFFTKILNISSEKKKKILCLTGVLLMSSIPLFCGNVYYGHDIEFHMNRIVSIAKEISSGHFPVRIHSNMLNDYGYATSLFYGDTMLYIPAILYLAKVPLGQCYQLYILINNILTLVFSYACFKAIVKKEEYALTGVFLYMLAPYRLINIYTRAAVGEFTAMTFFPLIVLGFWNIYTKETTKLRDYLPAVVGLSGVVQSHVISTEMAAIFIGLVCIVNWRKTIKLRTLSGLMKTVCLTMALSLWFLIPMIDSMSMDVNVTGRIGRMQEQGLYPIQIMSLFFSGVGQSLKNTTQAEMGFSLGLALCIGTGLALWVYARYKAQERHSALEKSVVTFLGMGIIALLFTSRFFPWDTLACRNRIIAKYLCMIQYPWRYLAIATMMLSIASVGALRLWAERNGKAKLKAATGAIILLCAISTGYYYYHFTYESNMLTVFSEADCNPFYIGDGEYLLKGTKAEALALREIKCDVSVEAAELERADGNYAYVCKNNSDIEQAIVLPILNYEHYVVKDIENDILFDVENGENNCISVILPPKYQGSLTVSYQERRIWRFCDVISFMTAVCLIAVGVEKRRGS